jgi:excisionase family DNA binding protein
MDATRRLVRAKELSEALDVPVNTIYDRAKKDGWPSYRIGRDVRFDLEEILALIRRDEP